MEIQNVENPGYSLVTRGQDYLSRMVTYQNGREYDYRNYKNMKKNYVIWILPQAAKKRDGHMNRYKTTEQNISGTTIEKIENYDKGEQIMIYLNKDHDIENKYDRTDWVLTPLVVFFNNTLDLLGKKNIIKEYGFEEIEREVTKMCNLGEMIVSESIEKGLKQGIKQGIEQGIEQGQKKKNIEHVRNLMNELPCSMQRAMDILKLTTYERKEIEKYFQA